MKTSACIFVLALVAMSLQQSMVTAPVCKKYQVLGASSGATLKWRVKVPTSNGRRLQAMQNRCVNGYRAHSS